MRRRRRYSSVKCRALGQMEYNLARNASRSSGNALHSNNASDAIGCMLDRLRVVGVTTRARRVTDPFHTGRTTPERVASHPEFRLEPPSFAERAWTRAFQIFRQSKPGLVHPGTHIPKCRQVSDAVVELGRLTCRQDFTNKLLQVCSPFRQGPGPL